MEPQAAERLPSNVIAAWMAGLCVRFSRWRGYRPADDVMAKDRGSVRYVKFTQQEMAYDGPSPSKRKKWQFVGRGKNALLRKTPAKDKERLTRDKGPNM